MAFVRSMRKAKPYSASSPRPDGPTLPDVGHLGGRAALYLLALVRAHHSRKRVAPTAKGSDAVLSALSTLGLIQVDSGLEGPVVSGHRPAWSYTWSALKFEELEKCLTDYLLQRGREPEYAVTWLRVWQELLPQEVMAYLEHQLRLHHFSDVYLGELARLQMPHDVNYSLGHWRYACWASVRSMASVSLQYPGNAEILKFTLGSELPRRLKMAQGSKEGKLCFSASHTLPDSALTTVFANIATNLGDQFWMVPPSMTAIEHPPS